MKLTLFVTQECNLACDYCYVGKRTAVMQAATARRALDFIAGRLAPGEDVDIGLFGGEPLLALPRVLEIARLGRAHPLARGRKLDFQLITNGTLLDESGIESLAGLGVDIGISCDGPPPLQNLHRRYRDGRSSGADVERGIRLAVRKLPRTMVNAVYRPDTIRGLPDAVSYLYGLGVRAISCNPDYGADWRESDVDAMREAYTEVGDLYVSCHLRGDPARISLVDAKIAVLLNGGYAPHERCSLGRHELAIGPEGTIYPCERLAGDCKTSDHCVGTIDDRTLMPIACPAGSPHAAGDARGADHTPCRTCSVRDYCMHWCGCSNFFATGSYDHPGAFLCASEKEALRAASRALSRLSEAIGPEIASRLAAHESGVTRAGRTVDRAP